MKNILILLLVVVPTLAISQEKIKYDKALAIELSKAYLQAYFRYTPDREVKNINWEQPILADEVDGNGRSFVFVGFKASKNKVGASMRLEICGAIELYPSWYGASSDVDSDHTEFKLIAGNKTADYPGKCPDAV